jgi:hypothetical protein
MKHSNFDIKAWIVPCAVTGVLVAAVVSYPRAAEVHAAPGSPYYPKAAREALEGLRNPDGKQAAPAIPALPAGLSPDEHYWCEQCKAYHKRQPGAQAAVPHAAPVDPAAVPALPAGYDAADHYWCPNCKVYHSRSNPQAKVPGVPQP